MLKQLFFSVAVIAMPAFASAGTLTPLLGTAASITKADKASSADMTGLGSWDLAPRLLSTVPLPAGAP